MTGLCWFPPYGPWLGTLVRILRWKAGILNYRVIHRSSKISRGGAFRKQASSPGTCLGFLELFIV